MEFVAPVAGFFFKKGLNLADGGLPQVDDVHGRAESGATPVARDLS
jgi:hypothetical protein